MAGWKLTAIGDSAVKIEYDLRPSGEFKDFYFQIQNGNIYFPKSYGTITINGLNKGAYNTIVGPTINRSYTEIYYNEGQKERDVEDSITLSNLGCYTHPGAFSFGAISAQTNPADDNSIISNVLTTQKVNKWIEYVNKAYCWKQQNSNGYTNLNNLSIPENKVITAQWYNNCASALRGLGKTISDVNQNDLITANVINALNFQGVSV